jgi:hypothetical protein
MLYLGINGQAKLNKVSASEPDSRRSLGCCEHSKEFLGSITGREFLDQLSEGLIVSQERL